MKKVLVLLVSLLLLSGCQISEASLKQELSNKVSEHFENVTYPKNNTYRLNYSYYLPANATIEDRHSSNDIIKVNQEKLYLFVDLYSYKNSLDIGYDLSLKTVYRKTVKEDNLDFDIVVYQYQGEYIILASNDFARVSSQAKVGYIPEIVEVMITLLSTIDVDDTVVFAKEVEVEVPIIETIDIFKSKVEETNVIKEQSSDE